MGRLKIDLIKGFSFQLKVLSGFGIYKYENYVLPKSNIFKIVSRVSKYFCAITF